MNYTLATIFLWIIFFIHRIFAFSYHLELSPDVGMPIWRLFLVGTASDFWISAAIMAFFSLLAYFLELLTKKDFSRGILITVLVIFAILTAGHQSYVEFFKYQILPFHLRYLLDKEFLQANGPSSVHLPFVSILALGVVLAFAFAALTRKKRKTFLLPVALVILAVTGHVLQIRWKVQWFIPENLQVNYVERVYSYLTNLPSFEKLNAAESDQLNHFTGSKTSPFTEARPSRATELLRNQLVVDDKPKIYLTIVLESFRFSDAGVYFPNEKKQTITPVFDELSKTGVLFTKAYSNGTVTRSGQEAVWCGYQGGTQTSLMRTFPRANIPCLPRAFSKSFQNRGQTMWLHGGEGKFDAQRYFWKRKGVEVIMDSSEFPADAPRNDWGIGDRAFFKRAFEKILTNDSQNKSTFAMLLSVSNHIPWGLPSDAPQDIVEFAKHAEHPSYATMMYADFSLGEFVANLKKNHLWERTVIAIVGDHGNLEKPYHDFSNPDPIVRAAIQVTHVGMLLTGGLIEAGVKTHLIPPVESNVVSLADVATFWNLLLDLRTPTMGYDLFLESQKKLIVSNVDHGIYAPAQEKMIKMDESSSDQTLFERLYIRRLFDFLHSEPDSSN